jgi:hypothetical protein
MKTTYITMSDYVQEANAKANILTIFNNWKTYYKSRNWNSKFNFILVRHKFLYINCNISVAIFWFQ